jgi:hypothetical protein
VGNAPVSARGQTRREVHQVAFRKKIYSTVEELQVDPDVWIASYNHERTREADGGFLREMPADD